MNMPRLNRDYLPAIGLGVTQIMGYGTLMYAYAVLLPEMAKDLGLTLSEVFGILSLGLFFGGLVSPIAGKLVDHCGGRWVMTLGSIAASLALMAMSQIEGRIGLFVLILVAEGAGMFVLYNVAFASVARLDLGVLPQRSISVITLFGGVASTIFWPLTLALFNRYGWETTWVILGFSALLICTPIHFFVLRGPERAAGAPKPDNSPDWPELTGHLRKQAMLWMVCFFHFFWLPDGRCYDTLGDQCSGLGPYGSHCSLRRCRHWPVQDRGPVFRDGCQSQHVPVGDLCA